VNRPETILAERPPVEAGRWRVRVLPPDHPDALRALDLRARLYRRGDDDRDAFDAKARHMLVEERGGGACAACARLFTARGAAMAEGYTGQFYDLARLIRPRRLGLELGRVAIDPALADPDLWRLMLASLARLAREEGVQLFFGCASFRGADPEAHAPALARLRMAVAPEGWRPARKAPEAVPLPERAPGPPGVLPAILRSWLNLGARVSDHAVIDRDLDTLDVFTGLPVAAVPAARRRLLLGMVGDRA
jgi:putative hemolysin